MSNIDRAAPSGELPLHLPPKQPVVPLEPKPPTMAVDALNVRKTLPPIPGVLARTRPIPEAADPALIDELAEVAHDVHQPHGVLHGIETGERIVDAVREVTTHGSRAVGSAAEVVGGHHHGILGWCEHHVTRGVKWLSQSTARLVSRVPGGEGFVQGVQRVLGYPGRLLGPRLDVALKGTQVGEAVRFTGSGGRMVGQLGGRLPLIGALLGGLIAVVDVRHAWQVLQDPHAGTGGKVVAGLQGLLSGASGVLGMGALACAGALAIGLTAPFSIPALLGAAAVTGIGAFALSFFVPRASH